jgi:hypothetical protein
MRNLVARLLVLLFLRPGAARRGGGGGGGGGGGSSATYFFGDECSIPRLEAYPWPTNVSSTNVTTGDAYRRIYVGGSIVATEVTPMPGSECISHTTTSPLTRTSHQLRVGQPSGHKLGLRHL